MAISPDGATVVYVGVEDDTRQLYLRPLDRFEFALIPGSKGASNPFFSADGKRIGFFADGKLKKVQASGGSPLTICDAAFGFGAAWSPDDTIVFGGALQGGLSRVSANGGQPQPFTKLRNGERVHRWPAFIPGTRNILFAAASDVTSWTTSRVAIQSLDSGEHRILLEGGPMMPQATDHIIFARSGPFSASRSIVPASPLPVRRLNWCRA